MKICLVFFLLATLARAEQYELFTYRVVGDAVEITDYPTDAVGEVEIPAEISGMPVTVIGEVAFEGCTGLTSVTIPDSVIGVGDWAFRQCTGLASVTIPEGVTTGLWAGRPYPGGNHIPSSGTTESL